MKITVEVGSEDLDRIRRFLEKHKVLKDRLLELVGERVGGGLDKEGVETLAITSLTIAYKVAGGLVKEIAGGRIPRNLTIEISGQ
ncbi:MAG: hypothetical protein ABDH32_03305 [Candidatus Caldarchaeales archaeon]